MASWCLEGSDFGSQEVYLINVEFPPGLEVHQRCWSFIIVSNQNWIDILVRMQEVSIR